MMMTDGLVIALSVVWLLTGHVNKYSIMDQRRSDLCYFIGTNSTNMYSVCFGKIIQMNHMFLFCYMYILSTFEVKLPIK